MLLRIYLNDRPKLTVHPVHPDTYQWWFRLPDGKHENKTTRKYGFLTYIDITNRGLRRVSIDSWRLYIKTNGFRQVELKPISIPEPQGKLGQSGHVKIYRVLGQKGPSYEGDTIIESGTSLSGMAYYTVEFYGKEIWNPQINDKKIKGKLVIRNVFGTKTYTHILFSEVSLSYVKSIIENIDQIV
jgi:hypothetical protein